MLTLSLLWSCSDGKEPPGAELSEFTGWQEYAIVRSDTDSRAVKAAVSLRKSIIEATGVELVLTTDYVKRGEEVPSGTHEILVGSTNRAESSSELLLNDWEIEFSGERLAIRGGSESALLAAVEWFSENCVKADKLLYPSGIYHVSGEYPWANVSIEGVKLCEYAVASDDQALAAELTAQITEMTGRTPPEKSEHTINIVNSDEVAKYAVAVSSDKSGVRAAVNLLDLSDAYELLIDTINARKDDTMEKIEVTRSIEVADFAAGAAKLAEVNSLAEKRISEILSTESVYEVGKNGTVYYVSNNGDDNSDGKTPETAKATSAGLTALKSGDVVLFERGGLWRQQLKTVSGVTYSAYGEGEKPMIYSSPENGADPSKWTLLDGTDNIWVYSTELLDVGNVVFNEGAEYGFKAVPYYKDGSFHNADGSEFDVVQGLDCDLKFFSKADSKFSGNNVPVGDSVGKLYLRCDKGNPGEIYDSIEFLIRRHGIALAGDNIIIDNLCVKYVGSHGIGGGTVGNVTIRNCEIGWIGGVVQFYTPEQNQVTRFGNGIEIYGGCDSYTIENCYVHDCYDAGITHQYQRGGTNSIVESNVTYKDNVIERCAYNIEYFMGAVESGSAKRVMNNVLITGNLLRDAGKCFGARPHSVQIMGWGHRNEAYDFVIEDNIFSDAENRIFYIGAQKAEWLPTFRNNTYIQKFGGQFALYGILGSMTESSYSRDFDQKIGDITGETGAEIYYIE